jgi:hypothetical protein
MYGSSDVSFSAVSRMYLSVWYGFQSAYQDTGTFQTPLFPSLPIARSLPSHRPDNPVLSNAVPSATAPIHGVINSVMAELHLNNNYKFISYLTVNTLHIHYQDSKLTLAARSENYLLSKINSMQ